jgi:hypothetical protein
VGAAPQIEEEWDDFFDPKKSSDPIFVPAAIAGWADSQLAGLPVGELTAAQLLTERAAISGHVSRGLVSPGGSCRLLEAADGWLALNLARDEDWDLLPAWLESEITRDWDAVARAVRTRPARELVGRGREIGLAVAVDEPVGAALGRDGFAATPVARKTRSYDGGRPRVIDLSSLWAGPLCGHLLLRCGAEVVKVESLHRPDGARRGPPLFFDLLNGGKASVALDFAGAEGRAQLAALIASADIVIEGSRPRALRQLGIDAAALCARRPGLVWLSITAYGRDPATEHWIGYGDDVAVAAGLTAAVHAATGTRRIVGDAIADPLTGIRAARLAWDAWRSGRGGLFDVSLHATMRLALHGQTRLARSLPETGRPIRAPLASARALGADTVVQLREAAGRSPAQTAGEAEGGLR